jgi:hypothetical protein
MRVSSSCPILLPSILFASSPAPPVPRRPPYFVNANLLRYALCANALLCLSSPHRFIGPLWEATTCGKIEVSQIWFL